MEAAAKLMNKLGKLPKERLCMQDIGLSDIQVTTFLQHCVTLLDIFIDVRGYGKLRKLWRISVSVDYLNFNFDWQYEI